MPSRDEILALYKAGPNAMVAWVQQLFDTRDRQLANVAARVAQLESSQNKGRQPVMVWPRSRTRAACAGAAARKAADKRGIRGAIRLLVADPNVVVVHEPQVCQGCGASLTLATPIAQDRRQVIEIPRPHPKVTEHQALHKACAVCQTETVGMFSAEVTQPVQYGPRLKAVMVYLQVHQLLSFDRLVEALHELYGVEPSEGTLASAQALAYTRLAPVARAIHGVCWLHLSSGRI